MQGARQKGREEVQPFNVHPHILPVLSQSRLLVCSNPSMVPILAETKSRILTRHFNTCTHFPLPGHFLCIHGLLFSVSLHPLSSPFLSPLSSSWSSKPQRRVDYVVCSLHARLVLDTPFPSSLFYFVVILLYSIYFRFVGEKRALQKKVLSWKRPKMQG